MQVPATFSEFVAGAPSLPCTICTAWCSACAAVCSIICALIEVETCRRDFEPNPDCSAKSLITAVIFTAAFTDNRPACAPSLL